MVSKMGCTTALTYLLNGCLIVFKIENLRSDMEYEFRVIAVNAAGESDPSRPSKPFLACDPADAPGLVSDLELIDSTNSSLTFQWKGTDIHGGAEFLGYDIELQKVKIQTFGCLA